jgi:heme o synthase
MSIASSATQSTSSAAAAPMTVENLSAVLRQRRLDYAELCRPRIALMTMISVAVGFTLASPIQFQGATLLIALVGILQLVAASSMLNQCLERHTDARMTRTANRPLAAGRIPAVEATIVSVALTLSGFVTLWNLVNGATAIATLATLVVYVAGYTLLKTRTSLCTTVGAIPGAMPPVLGWLAAGGHFGVEAIALFAVFFVWQFPHFLAIGWIHRKDYEGAGLRMLPSFKDNGLRTGIIALVYAVAFVPVSILPTVIGMTGDIYFAAATIMSLAYLLYTIRFAMDRSDFRARKLLYNSLLCLPLLLLALVVDFLRLTAM